VSRRRLVGVGVGPGAVDLITVQAVQVLQAADLVLLPTMDTDTAGRAERTVRAHVTHDRLQRLTFALNERSDRARREAAWDAAGACVAAALDDIAHRQAGAATVAFATIGDPNVYSTFSYLAATVRQRRPDVEVSTVPGITAMQHLAAAAGVPLVEGEEILTLYPLTAGLPGYREALRRTDTVVAYKGGRQLPGVVAILREEGRLPAAVVGAGLGLPGENICAAAEVTTELPYLSTVLAPPGGRTRGGRL
jgi:precorrin-2/cobalt-factor-2 C20-methyltransferase